ADLAPVSIAPVVARPGEAVTFSAIIRNIGSAATLRTQTAATFQLLPRAGGAAVFSGWGVPMASVAPGADLTIAATYGGAAGNGVWTAVRGEYTLRLQVDDADRVPESSSANNVLRINVDVVDSIPTVPAPQIAVTPRGDGTATFTLQNPPAGSGLIYDWSVIAAPAGAKAVTFASRSQTTTAVHFLSGRYQYGVIIRNSLGAILGTQVLSDPVNIAITADLRPVSSATVRAKTGERVGFGAVLQNFGTSAGLYAQTAATFELLPKAGGARIPVGFGVKVIALGAGASVSVPATHGGPLGTGQWIAVKGEYTLRVIADDIDRIPESNNGNNIYTVDFSVTD
ncbi:MAG: hypothetical protein J0L84_16435, partial [Verrucomicrobia bacterium]|nr:hypothetical protein [Verrucomicrobiota bacterium]